MPLKPKEIESKLQSKFDFCSATAHSSDHKWYELELPGLPTIRTKVSHGKKTISHGLESAMARQLRVRTQFFRGMINCTKSAQDYYEQVQEDPYPPFDKRF